MKIYFSFLLIFSSIITIFSLIPKWDLSKAGINLLNSQTYKYVVLYKVSDEGVELNMTRTIYYEDDEVKYYNTIFMSYDYKNFITKNVPFDYVQSFYRINEKYILCPKGRHHPYNLNEDKEEIPKNFEEKAIKDWDLKCFMLNDDYLLIFYLINGNKNFFYRSMKDSTNTGIFLTQDNELYDCKVDKIQFKENEYENIVLIEKNGNLVLTGKLFFLKEGQKDQYNSGDTVIICSNNTYTQAYFRTDTNSFYYITYNDIYNFKSGYVLTSETNIDTNDLGWAKNIVNNNKTPFEFIDEFEVEEMNFMLYNKFVYYKIVNKNNNKIYHGVLDVIENKIVFNTDEEIKNFIPYSSTAMLAIMNSTAYKICIYSNNDECVEECGDKYNLDIDGNKCGSSSGCPENKIMLIPNKICIESCDNTYLIENDGQCGVCKDIFPEEKPYKLINGTECIAEFDQNSMEYLNENLKILKCKPDFKFENNECISDKKCHENCLTCDEYSEDIEHQNCTSCIDGLYLEGENCKENCSEGYGKNKEEKTCIKCEYDLCESFTINTCDCEKCIGKYFLNSSNLCSSCDESCEECIDDFDKCTKCDDNHFLLENKCYNCSNNCSIKEEDNCKCKECNKGFYADKYICKSCINNCDKCSNSTKCENCKEGFFVNDEGECQSCSLNCFKKEEDNCKCSECDKGFYVDKYICNSCIVNCDKCSNATKCENCKEGFFANDEGICQECPLNCNKCSNSTKCEHCKGGFFINDEGDCQSCPSNCLKNEPDSCKCSECDKGYYVDKHICNSCINNCDKCSNSTKCENCKEGFFVNDEGECQSCPLNCKTKDTDGCQCKVCDDEYFLKNKNCEKCDTNCQTCIGESNHCTSCKSDNYFINNENKCQECSGNCKTCSIIESNCTSCEDKKYLNKENNKCEECSVVCETCSSGYFEGNDNCDSCNTSSEYKYFIDDINNKTCVKNCTELGRDLIQKNKCGPKKNNSDPVTPDNKDPNGGESEKSGTDYLLWIFIAVIAIFLIVITICIVKKCCFNKDSNSFYEDITNELDEKEIIN